LISDLFFFRFVGVLIFADDTYKWLDKIITIKREGTSLEKRNNVVEMGFFPIVV
jgi:hypothetical protein